MFKASLVIVQIGRLVLRPFPQARASLESSGCEIGTSRPLPRIDIE